MTARGPLTRRQLLEAMSVAGVAGALGISDHAMAAPVRPAPMTDLAARAAAVAPAGSDLGAIEHVVFLMMENRSYDHYFGAYPKGRGFDDHPKDSLGVFAQAYPDGAGLTPPNVLLPFRLTTPAFACTDDLTHDWGPMHQCWNGGRMDSFASVHTSAKHEAARGVLAMSYYTRAELPYYYALADGFTLCDAYHSSVLGPTHPNRLYANTGTIDPTGAHGGPVCSTNGDPNVRWTCTWPTVQERLQDANVPWKVYNPSNVGVSAEYASLAQYPIWNPAIYNPILDPEVMLAADNVLPYFKSFESPASPLYKNAFNPTFPADFQRDVAQDTLPSVSWLIPPFGFDDHPSASPDRGMWFTQQVLNILVSNPTVWSKTVFFLMYDENDGFFDHVAPPVPPAGTPGETVTGTPASTADTAGFTNPIGLGVRVPMLVMSPFSRGGHIASELFDHTSQLRFLEQRFGIHVDTISAWRRSTVGDLTSTLHMSSHDLSMPALPRPPTPTFQLTGACAETAEESELGGTHPILSARQRMPTQDGRLLDPATFGLTKAAKPGTKPPDVEGTKGKPTVRSATGALAATGGLPVEIPAAVVVAGGLVAAAAVRRARSQD